MGLKCCTDVTPGLCALQDEDLVRSTSLQLHSGTKRTSFNEDALEAINAHMRRVSPSQSLLARLLYDRGCQATQCAFTQPLACIAGCFSGALAPGVIPSCDIACHADWHQLPAYCALLDACVSSGPCRKPPICRSCGIWKNSFTTSCCMVVCLAPDHVSACAQISAVDDMEESLSHGVWRMGKSASMPLNSARPNLERYSVDQVWSPCFPCQGVCQRACTLTVTLMMTLTLQPHLGAVSRTCHAGCSSCA